MEENEEFDSDFNKENIPISGDFWNYMESYWHNNREFPESTEDHLKRKADLIGGKVPSSQLSSYVDDVVEFESFENLPNLGEKGKIYVLTNNNSQYRWSGSEYIQLNSDLSLMTTNTNQEVSGRKTFYTTGGNGSQNNTLWVDSNDSSYPGMSFRRPNIDVGQIKYADSLSGFWFVNNGNSSTIPIVASKFIKEGGTGNNLLKDDGNTIAISSLYDNYIPYKGATQNVDLNSKNISSINRINTTGSIKHNGLGLSLVNISGSGWKSSVLIKTGFTTGNMGTFTVKLYHYGHEYFEFNVSNYKYDNSNYYPKITWKSGNSKRIQRIEFLKDSNNVLFVNIVADLEYPRLAITDFMGYEFDDAPFDSVNWSAEWNGDTSSLINEGGEAFPEDFLRDDYIGDSFINYWKKYTIAGYVGINASTPFSFLNNNETQKVYMGGLLVSNDFNDEGLVPTNGIYSKGSVLANDIALGDIPNTIRLTRQTANEIGILSETNDWANFRGDTFHSLYHGNSNDWYQAFNWGNHADAGYLTSSYLEDYLTHKGGYNDSLIAKQDARNSVTYYAGNPTTTGFKSEYGTSLHLYGGINWFNRLDISTTGDRIDFWQGINSTDMLYRGVIPIIPDGNHGWHSSKIIGKNKGIITNLDAELPNGGSINSYYSSSWGGSDTPTGASYGGYLKFSNEGDGNNLDFYFNNGHNTMNTHRLWFRTKNNLGVTEWFEFWNSGNFNPDNYIPTTHPIYSIEQGNIDIWNNNRFNTIPNNYIGTTKNANNITNSGFYTIAEGTKNTGEYTSSQDGQRMLLHFETENIYSASQIQTERYNGNILSRTRTDGIWSGWIRHWGNNDFTKTEIDNWNKTYNWGNHASFGYATQSWVHSQNYITPSFVEEKLNELSGEITNPDSPFFIRNKFTTIIITEDYHGEPLYLDGELIPKSYINIINLSKRIIDLNRFEPTIDRISELETTEYYINEEQRLIKKGSYRDAQILT